PVEFVQLRPASEHEFLGQFKGDKPTDLRTARAKFMLTTAIALPSAVAFCQHKPESIRQRPISFSRQVRPILADKCFKCHGPDNTARKANLRLDQEKDAFAALASGKPIVPGHPEQSRAFLRIVEKNPALRMPPPDSGKTLSTEQIDLIRKWIQQGAKWEQHWSFIPPSSPPIPQTMLAGWAANPIDSFILARLAKAGLKPSPPASRETLIRRVTLDLTGIPPTPAKIDAF